MAHMDYSGYPDLGPCSLPVWLSGDRNPLHLGHSITGTKIEAERFKTNLVQNCNLFTSFPHFTTCMAGLVLFPDLHTDLYLTKGLTRWRDTKCCR